MEEALGVVALAELGVLVACPEGVDDEDEGGRGIAVVTVGAVLTIFFGLVGDMRAVEEDNTIFGLGGVGGGVVFIGIKAARCGRGLIGREFLSEWEIGDECCSFFSSSDESRRRRWPVLTGDGGLD